ncbi:MAG: hypothetical protein O8C64_10385 [Candidatus Methanoperedens sp.]|nr:hypothetical protein [Candidatus Methanoperedens sp.]MCZ7405553.1 hypothetical protein [Candidatus Methanoperedens sp.]
MSSIAVCSNTDSRENMTNIIEAPGEAGRVVVFCIPGLRNT